MDPRLSVNTIGYGPRPAAEFLPELAEHGIDRLGVPLVQLAAGNLAANLAAMRAGGFDVATTVVPVAFTLPDPSRWPAERDRLRRGLDVAAEVGARVLYSTTGPMRSLTWEEAADRFVDAIAPVASCASELGVRLAIENTTTLRADLGFVHLLGDTVDLARRAGIWVCADLFVAWADRTLEQELADGMADFAMVQVADFVLGTMSTPDRAVPGDGDLPIARHLAWLEAAGYRGLLELELLGPRITAEGPAAAAARALRVLTGLLTKPSA